MQNKIAKHGVLVIGHGSRREEANEDVRAVARQIMARGNFSLVQAAFLSLAAPAIEDGYAMLVDQGATTITVHPYFLSPGRHTRGDVPQAVARAAARYPSVAYRISEPLAAHPLVVQAAIERINECSVAERDQIPMRSTQSKPVYIVGAGPGDPGLLTVRARDLIAAADVLVYDYLVNPELLRYTKADCVRHYVGKVGGGQQTPQTSIDRLLIDAARAGNCVVRLKGGDPFIFGRGGEEALALRAAGLKFEIVPGISSALAVPAYAGIPLTHRGIARSVSIITGSQCGTGYEAGIVAAAAADTVVVLMGMTHIEAIVRTLLAAGHAADTPTAVMRWGTYESQRTIVATLATLQEVVETNGIQAPAVIVVGQVVALRRQLAWFESEIVFAGAAGRPEIESNRAEATSSQARASGQPTMAPVGHM